MKTVRWAGICGAAAGLLLASSSFAQKEQWLRYYTASEGRGYRYIELKTNAPPELKLPKLTGQAYYARWETPLDPAGGRWMVFERKGKTGPYDRVYIDAKGDGNLSGTPVAASRSDQFSAFFPPVKMVFKGEDGPLTYHLNLRFMKYDQDQARLLASSGCYYAGDVDLGGKKRRVDLFDQNVNGTFNDRGGTPRDSDAISVQNSKKGQRSLGKLVEVDGAFYNIEIARDGAFLKAQKAENVKFGKVKLPETISSLIAFGETGHFTRTPDKGEITLPTGNYSVEYWAIKRKDSKGASWEMTGYREKEACKFEVAAGETSKAVVGEPVRMELSTRDMGTNVVSFNLAFSGVSGDSIQLMKGEQRPPGPKLILASADGTYRSTNTFEFG